MITDFVGTAAGAVCLVVICAASLLNVYAHWIDDGFVGRILYMSVAFTSMCGIIRFVSSGGFLPENVTPVLITLFACLTVRNFCVRSVRYVRYRKQHAKKHQ